MKITKHCTHCGSENLSQTADVRWIPETQRWEIDHFFDNPWCPECGDTTIVDKPMVSPSVYEFPIGTLLTLPNGWTYVAMDDKWELRSIPKEDTESC